MDGYRDRFQRLASEFRGIEAHDQADGDLYVRRVSALAAKALAAAQRDGAVKLPLDGWTPLDGENETWSVAWRMIVGVLERQYPDGLLAGVGIVRQTEQTEHVVVGELQPRDWQQRAREYAVVCDLLAKLAGDPSADPPGKQQAADDPLTSLSAEDRAIAILARDPGIRSIAAVARLVGCSRQHLSDENACPRFIKAWEQAQKASYRETSIVKGAKTNGSVEAWENDDE
jgi:hypothetical protein